MYTLIFFKTVQLNICHYSKQVLSQKQIPQLRKVGMIMRCLVMATAHLMKRERLSAAKSEHIPAISSTTNLTRRQTEWEAIILHLELYLCNKIMCCSIYEYVRTYWSASRALKQGWEEHNGIRIRVHSSTEWIKNSCILRWIVAFKTKHLKHTKNKIFSLLANGVHVPAKSRLTATGDAILRSCWMPLAKINLTLLSACI
jgi:hypothetical protein